MTNQPGPGSLSADPVEQWVNEAARVIYEQYMLTGTDKPFWERGARALASIPLPVASAPIDDDDDPSADPRWNAGVGFAMKLFCDYLGVDPDAVTWDAATETVDGDVSAVIGNILRTKYGEDFDPSAACDGNGYIVEFGDQNFACVACDGTGSSSEAILRKQIEAAARIMNDEGFAISLPWEGSLDDAELARYKVLRKAIAAALSQSPAPLPVAGEREAT
jgi:hypothetical protein